jgi:exonuclease SbcD
MGMGVTRTSFFKSAFSLLISTERKEFSDPALSGADASAKDREVCAAEKDFLEISLTGRALTENPLALLQKRFPNLLSIKQDEAFSSLLANHTGLRAPAVGDGERRNTADDFAEFLTGLYGQADNEELELFRELLAELETEEQL